MYIERVFFYLPLLDGGHKSHDPASRNCPSLPRTNCRLPPPMARGCYRAPPQRPPSPQPPPTAVAGHNPGHPSNPPPPPTPAPPDTPLSFFLISTRTSQFIAAHSIVLALARSWLGLGVADTRRYRSSRRPHLWPRAAWN